ncbi:hypothetical protein KSD_76810 [Ktedonobacter sp. SOSP1-85]|nr:hypothetical protein KSD_76810 [Ktedonobacter sp. SOSP1-85]
MSDGVKGMKQICIQRKPKGCMRIILSPHTFSRNFREWPIYIQRKSKGVCDERNDPHTFSRNFRE